MNQEINKEISMRLKFEGTKTKKNLEAAFAGESMANRKYLYFAQLAREFGDEEVAKAFEETAAQETQHAFSHLRLLYPKEQMSITKILEMAIAGERYEHLVMYPGFEQEALLENNQSAVLEFKEQGKESIEHEAYFRNIMEKASKKFKALTSVEKIHADHYQNILNKRK
jgi:rubrerythrin